MPYATLSRRQYAGFRTGNWSPQGGSATLVDFETPEEFARVQPPLFPVPACIVKGTKPASAHPLSADATTWTGRVPSHHMDWSRASPHLHSTPAGVQPALDVAESPYRRRFVQGANVVPRM